MNDQLRQFQEQLNRVTRRQFLGSLSMGLGAASLSQWWPQSAAASASAPPSVESLLNHAPTAKRVIFLCMAGGPSHLETFDHKPELARLDGQAMPESYTRGMPIAQLQGKELKCLGPRAKFKRCGKSGQLISEFLPHIGGVADDITIIRSMVTEQINHDPAHTFMNTGSILSGRPSMGSWVNYGLGSMNENISPGQWSVEAHGYSP